MIRIVLTFNGQGQLQMHRRGEDILAHLEQYVEKERSLPTAERTLVPSFSTMRDLHTKLQRLNDEARQWEDRRSAQDEAYRHKLADIKDEMKRIINYIQFKYPDEPGRWESWGFEVFNGERGWQVRKPRTNTNWENLLRDYMAYEEGLPVASRIPEPGLGTVRRWQSELEAIDDSRRHAYAERQRAVEARILLEQVVNEKLRLALSVILDTRYGGILNQELEDWGYPIIWPERDADEPEEGEGEASTS